MQRAWAPAVARAVAITTAIAGLGSSACASTTHYATARPLPAGEQAFAVSVDVTRVEDRSAGSEQRRVHSLGPEGDTLGNTSTARFAERKDIATTLIGVPTLRYRRGVGSAVQIGALLGGRGIGVETLVGLASGTTSLAWLVAPTLQGSLVSIDAPLLASRRVHERVDLVASLGPVLGVPLGRGGDALGGVFARLGVGLRLRFNSWLWIFPEGVAAESLGRSRRDTWLSAGLGFGGDFR